MKTVEIENKRLAVEYKTNSGLRTLASFGGRRYTQGLGCDVYNVDDGEHIALVLTSTTGTIFKSTTIISIEEYSKIADLYDPYHAGRYHTALLVRCGAENILKIL